MTLPWLLILLAFIGFTLPAGIVLRRKLPQLRNEWREMRTAARAVVTINNGLELTYQLQMAKYTPPLPHPTGSSPFNAGHWCILGGGGWDGQRTPFTRYVVWPCTKAYCMPA